MCTNKVAHPKALTSDWLGMVSPKKLKKTALDCNELNTSAAWLHGCMAAWLPVISHAAPVAL
jgi:hypothetical protein